MRFFSPSEATDDGGSCDDNHAEMNSPIRDITTRVDTFLRFIASEGREAVELALSSKEGLTQDIFHWIADCHICGPQVASFYDAYADPDANAICTAVANHVYTLTAHEVLSYAIGTGVQKATNDHILKLPLRKK